MHLGICYMVFDGEELLEFAARAIRANSDFISATYQTTSYYGNPADPGLPDLLHRLQAQGLLDEITHYDPDFTIHPKHNELKLRNIGLEMSRKAGCTHHISADVDEFYIPEQLEYAKKVMEEGYDFSLVSTETYYKEPTWMITPAPPIPITLIAPVDNEYSNHKGFPFKIEPTRQLKRQDNYKVFSKEEMVVHHMSYVRKDIRKKFMNSSNGLVYKVDKFVKKMDTYQVGDRVCVLPDFLNRRTVLVENRFGIHF